VTDSSHAEKARFPRPLVGLFFCGTDKSAADSQLISVAAVSAAIVTESFLTGQTPGAKSVENGDCRLYSRRSCAVNRIALVFAFLAFLSLSIQPVLAEEPVTLRWVGCGISKQAYMTALAKAYEQKTGVHIDLQGGGATRGIREVAAETADIGGSCRRHLWGEKEERGVTMIPVAWDALVVIVNKDNPVNNITMDDLRKVYLGKTTNWKQLGGADQPIKLFVREGKISGVGRVARKLLFNNYDQEFAATQVFPSSGPLEQAIEGDVNAVGITGVSSARKRKVKILNLNDKSPSYENVKKGQYLLYRPLYLVYNENSPHAAIIKDFIRFTDTPEGRDVIRANGTLPYLEGLNLIKANLQESRQAKAHEGLQ
jgi:phosphate transport system substrate-binding protein